MESNVYTVDALLDLLKQLSEQGYGNMKIKCGDSYLHDDEITCVYCDRREVRFCGMLHNQPIAEKANRFKEDVDKAVRRLYGQAHDELGLEEVR